MDIPKPEARPKEVLGSLPEKNKAQGFSYSSRPLPWQTISTQDKINFSRHLSIMIKAGLPVLEALKIVDRQSESKALKKVIGKLVEGINSGHSLAAGLSDYRDWFGDFFISIVEVGEQSGTLVGNLAYLAEELEKSRDLKSKIRGAMLYPIIILIATLAVTALLTFAVFPRVIPVLLSLNVQLPLPTRIMMAAMQFLTTYGWQLGLVLIILGILYRYMLKRVRPFRVMIHHLILYVPVVASMSRSINAVNFARVLSVLLKSGIRIVEAVQVTARTLDNLVYRSALDGAAEEIRKGEGLAKSLSNQPRLFTPLLLGLIEVGENTGNLEDNLGYLSEHYAKEVDITTRNLTTILEPLMLLGMGLLVGFVALAIVLPIYQATTAFR